MRIGLVCIEKSGHLNPSLTLGRELARHGHAISIITAPPARSKVERAGFPLLPVGEKEHAEGRIDALFARLAKQKGLSALLYTGYALSHLARIHFRDLPEILRRAGFDGLVIDQACPAAAQIAERLAMPYTVICNALPIHYDPVCPPPPTLWRYRTDFLGRHRNQIALRLCPPIFDLLTGNRRTGVSPLWLSFADPPRGLAHVAQQPEFFDFPRVGLPDFFHYTGPWHEQDRDDDMPFPWERLDDRPLIYASLGTIQNGLNHVYSAMIDAARGLDAQLVISLGRAGGALTVPPSENAIVVPFAPQLRLLERAALAITHAGMNTALECLTQGVPMVCLPIANDQPGVARRVEWIGAGEVLPIRQVTAKRLRHALNQVLSDPRYRRNAERCRDRIAATDGAAQAARILHRALSHNERILREPAADPRRLIPAR